MSKIKDEMKNRIKPLIELLFKANKLIHQAQQNAYKVEMAGFNLRKFSKDFCMESGVSVSPEALKATLRQIDAEVVKLKSECYEIHVSSRRPNGHDALYLESVSISLNCRDDWDQRYPESFEDDNL